MSSSAYFFQGRSKIETGGYSNQSSKSAKSSLTPKVKKPTPLFLPQGTNATGIFISLDVTICSEHYGNQ